MKWFITQHNSTNERIIRQTSWHYKDRSKTSSSIRRNNLQRDNFNIWFRHPDNGAEYAHEGIYLRTDKLSESQVTDYLRKSYGLINGGFLFSKPYSEMISDLYKAVQKDWQNKRSNENNTDRQ